jgi:predicted anti-sigma-YlaC factor YlaD
VSDHRHQPHADESTPNPCGSSSLSCQEICAFLCDFVDGTLSGPSKAAFDAHVAQCAPCKQYLDTYAQTILLSKRCCCPKLQPPPPLPEDMIRAIVQAAALSPASPKSKSPMS